MAGIGKTTFMVSCQKHGKVNPSRDRTVKELGAEPTSKKRNCCPVCRKEYIQKHNIKNAQEIDWRYINFEE